MADQEALLPISKSALSVVRSNGFALVAIDGPGGAGKSTIADSLAGLTGGTVVSGDDFYRAMEASSREQLDAFSGYMKYIHWERLQVEVLEPLRERKQARFLKYDWELNTLSGEVELSPSGVVIVEGVYSYRPELRGYYDLSVYVSTPRAECLRRLRARGHNCETWIQRWDAAEQYYFQSINIEGDFDFTIEGHSPA